MRHTYTHRHNQKLKEMKVKIVRRYFPSWYQSGYDIIKIDEFSLFICFTAVSVDYIFQLQSLYFRRVCDRTQSIIE